MNCKESSNILSLFIIQQPIIMLISFMIASIFIPFYLRSTMNNLDIFTEQISWNFYFLN